MKKKVKVYTTPTCPHCLMLKEFLKEKGIEFEEIDLSLEENQKKFFEEVFPKSQSLGVPQIEIDGKIIVGFDKEEILKALGLKKQKGN